MIKISTEQLKDLLTAFNNPELETHRITFINGDVLEIFKGFDIKKFEVINNE